MMKKEIKQIKKKNSIVIARFVGLVSFWQIRIKRTRGKKYLKISFSIVLA
jgi:hypothetical protein